VDSRRSQSYIAGRLGSTGTGVETLRSALAFKLICTIQKGPKAPYVYDLCNLSRVLDLITAPIVRMELVRIETVLLSDNSGN